MGNRSRRLFRTPNEFSEAGNSSLAKFIESMTSLDDGSLGMCFELTRSDHEYLLKFERGSFVLVTTSQEEKSPQYILETLMFFSRAQKIKETLF